MSAGMSAELSAGMGAGMASVLVAPTSRGRSMTTAQQSQPLTLRESWMTFTLLANAAATEASRLFAQARETMRDVDDLRATQARLQADAARYARYAANRPLTAREAADAAWLHAALPRIAADIGRFEAQAAAKRARASQCAAEAKRQRRLAGKAACDHGR